MLRRSLRAARVLLHIGSGFVVAGATGAFFAPHRPLVRRAARWWLGRLNRVLQVETVVHGVPPAQPALYVANHVSWLDIPVLGGLSNVHFLSKAEVASWPLIGPLATAAGTLYIRRGQGQVRQRTRDIAAHIADGRSILVFPEGTTTDGSAVLAFHSPLFAAATADGHRIQPVAIRYLDDQGRQHREVPFVGDDEFTGHLWRLLGSTRIRAEVHFLAPIPAGDRDPRELAAAARAAIETVVGARLPAPVPAIEPAIEPAPLRLQA